MSTPSFCAKGRAFCIQSFLQSQRRIAGQRVGPRISETLVRQLSDHYNKRPDQITEEELRQYFLHIRNVKKYARGTSTSAICGIKFFYEHTLKRHWTTLGLVRAAPEHKFPVILTIEEVLKVLGSIRLERYRVCLSTIYSCGLRVAG